MRAPVTLALQKTRCAFPRNLTFVRMRSSRATIPGWKRLLAVISSDILEHSNLTNSFFLGQRQPSYHPPDDLFLKLSKCLDCLEERQQKPPIKSSGLFAKKPPCQPYGNLRKSGGKHTQDTLRALMVTKWVDYSNKYGFGAQLSDGSVTVRFNDSTKIAISPGKRWVKRDFHKWNQLSVTALSLVPT